VKDQGYEDWRSMVPQRCLNTIQSEENSFQVPRVSIQKNDKKQDEKARFRTHWLPRAPFVHGCLQKLSCSHYFSFIKLAVQGNMVKHQSSKTVDNRKYFFVHGSSNYLFHNYVNETQVWNLKSSTILFEERRNITRLTRIIRCRMMF
jgi:hypothetical protein